MPNLEDLINKKPPQRKPFTKVNYRPWESTFIEKDGDGESPNGDIPLNSSFEDRGEGIVEKKDSFVANPGETIDDSSVALNKKEYTFKPIFKLSMVIGKYRKVLFFLANKEMERNSDYVICEPLSANDLSSVLNENNKYINVILSRLRKKGLIRTFEQVRGKGGYAIHGIPLFVIREIEKAKGQV